jgi:hypothetical protein
MTATLMRPAKVEAINYDIDAALLKIPDFIQLGIEVPERM